MVSGSKGDSWSIVVSNRPKGDMDWLCKEIVLIMGIMILLLAFKQCFACLLCGNAMRHQQMGEGFRECWLISCSDGYLFSNESGKPVIDRMDIIEEYFIFCR